MTISICIIATRKYKVFIASLLEGIKRHFFTDDDVQVMLFSDELSYFDNLIKEQHERLQITPVSIPDFKFPQVTLYRYSIIDEHRTKIKGDYIFYCDADMAIVGNVGHEILYDGLIATHHPGFHRREDYYAGGFQGGKRVPFLTAAHLMSNQIIADELRGWKPEHNDEWYWNEYLKTEPFKALTPSYCMVEQPHLRKQWGIAHFEPKIIALSKDHKTIRE